MAGRPYHQRPRCSCRKSCPHFALLVLRGGTWNNNARIDSPLIGSANGRQSYSIDFKCDANNTETHISLENNPGGGRPADYRRIGINQYDGQHFYLEVMTDAGKPSDIPAWFYVPDSTKEYTAEFEFTGTAINVYLFEKGKTRSDGQRYTYTISPTDQAAGLWDQSFFHTWVKNATAEIRGVRSSINRVGATTQTFDYLLPEVTINRRCGGGTN